MGHGTEIDHSISHPPERLIGRDAILADAVVLLTDPAVRLLTLTGPGGVGKTVLARAIAAAVTLVFPDGGGFVELAAERDSGRLLAAVERTLDLDLIPGEPPLATLARELIGPRLIILDNLEQLLDGADVLAELLTACPELTVLATSRSPLGLAQERQLPVPSLELPGPGAVPLSEIADSPAVQLFLRRARQANPAFTLSPGNARAVSAVCRRLDGLPLALELGAARLNLLSAEALIARLDARLDLLTGGPRDAPERHRSMRDTVTWSVDLLEPAERRVFAAFSVFAGGCYADDLAAVVAALTADVGQPTVDVPRAIVALLDGALLTTVSDPNGDPRLMMLESVRDVAAERLAGDGLADGACRAHAEQYRAVAERDGPVLRSDTVTQSRMWNRLHADIGNLRAALAWFLKTGDATAGLRLVAGLDWFWTAASFIAEGIDWIERLVARAAPSVATVPPAVWGDAHRLLSLLMDWLGRDEETERAASLAIAAFSGLPAHPTLVEALSVATNVALDRGELSLARARAERVLALADEHGSAFGGALAVITGNTGQILSLILALQGETSAAVARATAALDHYRRIGEVGYIPAALDTRAFGHLLGGDLAAAAADLAAALEASRPSAGQGVDEGQFLRSIFASVAQLAYRLGRPDVAAQLFAAADGEQRRIGVPTRKSLQGLIDVEIGTLRAVMGDPRFSTEWLLGAAAPQTKQIAMAAAFLRDVLSPPLTGRLTTLTPRELDVLRLVAAGHSNRAIGDALYISSETASKHVSHLLAKLCLPNRTAAAAYATEHGLKPGARNTASSG